MPKKSAPDLLAGYAYRSLRKAVHFRQASLSPRSLQVASDFQRNITLRGIATASYKMSLVVVPSRRRWRSKPDTRQAKTALTVPKLLNITPSLAGVILIDEHSLDIYV